MPAAPSASTPIVVTMGNPNTGKSTLFNRLTGLKQKVSNYPGVTVEQVEGSAHIEDFDVRLVDVPGTYSLAAMSPDEIIAVDVLQGAVDGLDKPQAVIVVVDASNLRRNLFLASQVLEAGIPTVLALNMIDRLPSLGIGVDADRLAQLVGVPVVPLSAAKGTGLDSLKRALAEVIRVPRVSSIVVNPTIRAAAAALVERLPQAAPVSLLTCERALIDEGGFAEQRLARQYGDGVIDDLHDARRRAGNGRSLSAIEARNRYSWIQSLLKDVETRRGQAGGGLASTADKILNHPVAGTLLFVLVMALLFQTVFAWAAPMVDAIDYLTGRLGMAVAAVLGPGLITSFVTDGIIAGVGSVIVFLPQILILFAFIIVLEDSGYMARAAFLMDRLMRGLGLSGQSFIPMLSSFACAVPGIMGARVIANPNDRLATIIAAPFMTCSARLPVYSLLIAAFVPKITYLGGFVNLQGLVLLGLYGLGIAGGCVTAFAINRVFWPGAKSRFLLEMPPYRLPNARAALSKLLSRALIFLKRAGTIIFAVALVIWALASFPRADSNSITAVDAMQVELSDSYLGQISRVAAPIFAPLGWDWKVTAAVIASFPAREVVIAALATIYAVGDSSDTGSTLTARIQSATHADGSIVYTLPMVMGLLLFYALCLQCMSTIAVIRRETATWRWPIAAWVYMTTLGYVAAFIAFRFGTWLTAA